MQGRRTVHRLFQLISQIKRTVIDRYWQRLMPATHCDYAIPSQNANICEYRMSWVWSLHYGQSRVNEMVWIKAARCCSLPWLVWLAAASDISSTLILFYLAPQVSSVRWLLVATQYPWEHTGITGKSGSLSAAMWLFLKPAQLFLQFICIRGRCLPLSTLPLHFLPSSYVSSLSLKPSCYATEHGIQHSNSKSVMSSDTQCPKLGMLVSHGSILQLKRGLR